MLEAPWLKTQIETHLIFGFFSRKFPFALFFVATCFLYLMYELLAVQGTLVGKLLQNIQYLFFLFIGFYMLKMPRYHQAAIGWWVVKISLFFFCIIFVIAGGLVGFFRGTPDYLYALLIGIIWLPSIEFISRMTERQKYLTIGRMLFSIPILILWQQTGTWH